MPTAAESDTTASPVRVRDLTTTDVVTVDAGRSLRDGAGAMVGDGVGSVIVVDGGNPVGIATETDALRAGAATDRSASAGPEGDVTTADARAPRRVGPGGDGHGRRCASWRVGRTASRRRAGLRPADRGV